MDIMKTLYSTADEPSIYTLLLPTSVFHTVTTDWVCVPVSCLCETK